MLSLLVVPYVFPLFSFKPLLRSIGTTLGNISSWIQGEEFYITKKIVFAALFVPLIQHPTYPFTKSPPLDDVMSLIYGRTIS